MWVHQRLTTLWASTACFRDNVTFFTLPKFFVYLLTPSTHWNRTHTYMTLALPCPKFSSIMLRVALRKEPIELHALYFWVLSNLVLWNLIIAFLLGLYAYYHVWIFLTLIRLRLTLFLGQFFFRLVSLVFIGQSGSCSYSMIVITDFHSKCHG
jgi:hypothetical protein